MVDDLTRGRRPLGNVAEYATDASGNTVLLGPDGTPLYADELNPHSNISPVIAVDWGSASIGTPTTGWTVEKNTTKTFNGKTTLKVTATAGASDTLVCAITIPSVCFGGVQRVGFCVAAEDGYISGDSINYPQLWLAYSGSTTHRINSYVWPSNIPGKWAEGFAFNGDLTLSGHINGTTQWAKFAAEETTTVSLVLTKRAGQAITNAVYIGPVITDPVSNTVPQLTLFMDGGYSGQYKYARKALKARSLRASLAIVVPWVGAGGIITLAQAEEMYDDGHEFICHTGTAGDYGWDSLVKYPDGSEYDLIKADFAAWKNWSRANGFLRGVDYAVVGFTNGLVNTQTLERRANIGNAIIDSDIKKVRQLGTYNSSYYSCVDDDYLVTQSTMVTSATATATLTSNIDSLIARGGWSGLTFHDFVLSGATGNSYNIADLVTVLDYIKTKVDAGVLKVVPFGEAMTRMGKGL
jgi:hypothetical protein